MSSLLLGRLFNRTSSQLSNETDEQARRRTRQPLLGSQNTEGTSIAGTDIVDIEAGDLAPGARGDITPQNQTVTMAEIMRRVASLFTTSEVKLLTKFEKRKSKLVKEEMILEDRADVIMNNFGTIVVSLSAIFMLANGALFATGKMTFITGFFCAFVMGTCFVLGVLAALMWSVQRFNRVKQAVLSLQKRYSNFFSNWHQFCSGVFYARTGSHGASSSSVSHVDSSPPISNSPVLFGAEIERMPVEFRVEGLEEETRVGSFLDHYKRLIYLIVGFAVAEVVVFGLIAYTAFHVVIPAAVASSTIDTYQF